MSTEGPELEESLGSLQIEEDHEESEHSSDEESDDSPEEESADSPDKEAELPDSPWRGLYYGDEIKRMISHTLNGWCSKHDPKPGVDPKPKIFIVTPFIDREGLVMIRDAIGNQGKIEALYTRDTPESPLGPTMQGILGEENFAQLRVGPHNIQDKKHYYHCKFVAAEFPDRVEILMTSANLTSTHFMREQIDSVHKYEVTPKAFEENYMQNLKKYSHDYEWKKKRASYAPTKQVVYMYYNGKENGHYAKECPKADCYRGGENGHTWPTQMENQQNGMPPHSQQNRMPLRSQQNSMPLRAQQDRFPGAMGTHQALQSVRDRELRANRCRPPNQGWDCFNRQNRECHPFIRPNQAWRRDPAAFPPQFPPPRGDLGRPYGDWFREEMNDRPAWPQRESGGHYTALSQHIYNPMYYPVMNTY